MRYYDHYHDPSTHLRLARQSEDELLRAARRRAIRPGLVARLRAILGGTVPAQPSGERATVPFVDEPLR